MQLCTTPTAPPIDAPARCYVADHQEVWQSILPGLHALYEQEDGQDWDIEGIRKLLDSGRGLLVVDADAPTGFAVVQLDTAPHDPKAIELFVYLAFHQGGDAIARFQPHLEYMARSAKAKYMRFYSRRFGMLKLATKVGYRARSVEYVKELRL